MFGKLVGICIAGPPRFRRNVDVFFTAETVNQRTALRTPQYTWHFLRVQSHAHIYEVLEIEHVSSTIRAVIHIFTYSRGHLAFEAGPFPKRIFIDHPARTAGHSARGFKCAIFAQPYQRLAGRARDRDPIFLNKPFNLGQQKPGPRGKTKGQFSLRVAHLHIHIAGACKLNPPLLVRLNHSICHKSAKSFQAFQPRFS